MTSALVSSIVVIISLILFFVLCFKGVGIIPIALILSLLVSTTIEGGITVGIWNYFSSGLGSLAGMLCFTFVTGAIFGGFMSASGSSEKIGSTLVNKFGVSFGPYCLVIFVMLLGYAGSGASAPILAATLAFPLMKAANMPRQIACVAIVGAGYLSAYYLPGAANSVNLILSSAFGTNMYAGAGLGLIICFIGVALNFLYIKWCIQRYKKKGIGYTESSMEQQLCGSHNSDNLPNFFIAILPMITVVALCMFFQLGIHMGAYPACSIAQICGIILCCLLNWNRIGDKLSILNKSSVTTIIPLIQACTVVGYASIVSQTAAYQALMDKVAHLNFNPYVLVVVGTALFALISADPMAGITMTSKTIGLTAINMGAQPGLVHRLTLISATTLESMPHSGGLNVIMNFLGLTHKEVYLDLVGCSIIIPIILSLIATIFSTIFG